MLQLPPSEAIGLIDTPNPKFQEFVQDQFAKAAFIQHLGIELVGFAPGWCETRLSLAKHHFQQDGVVHAGVVSTLADHTCGMAAGTLCPAGRKVLTVEFKLNLLRPGTGSGLRCRAEVVKPGKTLSVVQAEVRQATAEGADEAQAKLVAIMTATMALVE